jgi:hypothetical protein
LAEHHPEGHVDFATFGLSKINDRERFEKLIRNVKPGLDGYTIALLWREAYETHYEIFNHDDLAAVKARPLALMAMHPKEDSYTYSPLNRFKWKYRQYKIKENWGYNLTEFLELPWHDTQQIFLIEQRIAAEQLRREEEERRQAEAKAREAERQMAQPGMMRYQPRTPRGGKP